MKLRIGTSGYSYKEWKGRFYPKELPAAKFLRYYGSQFGTVEINSTFFALPKVATLEQWAGQVPEHFQFAFKASKYITHAKPLLDKADAVSRLCDIVGTLKDRCGPILFQFQESFKKDLPRLQAFLEALPAVRTAFEFRHASWFDNEVFASLRDRNAALCVADADDELVMPFVATADWGYLRLRREDYDDASLTEWLSRIRGQKWSEAFVYYKHEDEANGPRLAKRMLELAG